MNFVFQPMRFIAIFLSAVRVLFRNQATMANYLRYQNKTLFQWVSKRTFFTMSRFLVFFFSFKQI